MSVLQNSNAITPAADGFELKSVRCNFTDDPRLTRTPGSDGDKKLWTFSCWFKPATVSVSGDETHLFSADDMDAQNGWYEYVRFIASTGKVQWQVVQSSGSGKEGKIIPTMVFRDPSAWYHMVCRYDSANVTAADRMRIYINGDLVTDFDEQTTPAQNHPSMYFNDSKLNAVGNAYDANAAQWNGYIAEAYFIDGSGLTSSSFAETNEDTNQWQPKNPTDIKAGVTFGTNGFYLPFNNDALAASFTDADYHVVHTVTPIGTTHTDTTIKKFGTASCQLDGNSDYLSIPDSGDWVFGTGDFTLEAWVYNTTASGTQRLFCHTAHNVNGEQGFNVFLDSGGTGRLTWSTNGNNEYSWNFTNCMTQNTWTHFALTRTGTSLKVFKNGVLTDSTTDANMTTIYGGGKPLFIGAMNQSNSSVSGYFEGYIDEVRFSNIVRYSGAFSVATTAFTADKDTKLLLHMDGSDGGTTFTDSSWTGADGTGYAVTAVGDMVNTRVSNHSMVAQSNLHIIGPKIGSSAIAFDGTGDYLSAPDSADWTFGTGDFTLESWINTHALADYVIFSQYADASNRWYLRVDARAAQQEIGFYHHGASTSIAAVGVWPALNQWVHMAFVRASGVIKIYVDGVSQTLTTNTNASANLTDIAATLRIGDYNGSNNLNGYLDEIRISNSARYTANFTPSTTEFSSDANTKLLIHSNTTMGSTTFTDSSGSPHTITANGDVMNVAPKIGTGFGVWDGASYTETATAPAEFAFGISDVTIDFWAYHRGAWTDEYFLEAYGGSNDYWILKVKTGGDLQIESKISSLVVDVNFDNANMPTDAWVHIEVSRTGSTWRCFINGTETGDGQTSSGSMGVTPRQLKIGYSGQYNDKFTGYMDEFRISVGIVRHTSNFTPPTTALKDDKDTILLLHMDGGGGIDPETNLPTLPGQGTYFFDDSVNAIFYGADGVPTNKSLVNFPGNGYLTVPSSSDFNFGTGDWTIECWMFLTKDQTNRSLYTQATAADQTGAQIEFNTSTDKIAYYEYSLASNWDEYGLSNDAIPYGEWVHFAMVRNSLIFTMYINGVAQTATGNTSSNAIAAPTGPQWGFHRSDTARYLDDVFVDQMRVSNSARYTSNFTPSTTPFTTDANTKLLIQSDFSEGGLGADHSGNYNYFTPTNLTASDMMEDNPLNNFCTLNPLHWGIRNAADSVPLSEGNLKFTGSDTISTYGTWYATFQPSAGSYYFEMVPTAIGSAEKQSQYINVGGKAFKANGESSSGAYGTAWAAGDVIGVAVSTAGVWYSLNGTWQNSGDPVAGTNSAGVPSYPFTILTGDGSATTNSSLSGVLNFGQDSSFAGERTAQGNQDGNNKGDFFYAPPSGFLALCTDNLAAPSIALPNEHFDTTLVSGNGAARSITGLSFQPDFLWGKSRTNTLNHYLTDSVRGINKQLYSDTYTSENSATDIYTAFNSDGFSLGSGDMNLSGQNYVHWAWKGGGTAASNSDGSITSSVSANTTAGFSVVGWTGTGSNATVGHGLSQAPELVINKSRPGNTSTYQWAVQSSLWVSASDTNMLYLNANAAQADDTNVFQAAPTASVFSPQGGAWGGIGATEDYIAYCFHSVEGYSKIGTYTGNAGTDGTFVYTGFRPAYVMWKSTTASENWQIKDNKRIGFNDANYSLFANTNGIDYTTAQADLLSNGFKLRNSGGGSNGSGEVLIYIAIAESPFKTSNAR